MKTKVLHISGNQYPLIDKNHHTKKIWKELSKEFDEYHIIARSFDNQFHTSKEGKLTLHLIPKVGNRMRSFIGTSFYIFRIIPKYGITKLLAQSSIFGGLAAIWAGKRYRIPVMVEIHGEEYIRILKSKKIHYWPIKKMISYVFRKADKVRSLNSIMTKNLNNLGFGENIIDIPCRVDLTVFKQKKESFDIGDRVNLISIGRFVKEKNYLNLIKDLNNTKLNFHLTLVGGGPLSDKYKELIQQLNIEDKVILIDWIEQDELVNLLLNADLYIQYSVSEGMPRTILEAMAIQMPILTTDVGSIAGVIKNNKNGIILRLNDSKALQISIDSLIQSRELRTQIAQAAYIEATTDFEWNHVFKKYRKVLVDL